jgi:hypothetical protein
LMTNKRPTTTYMIHDLTHCTFGYLQKAKPKPQSLSRSHIRDLCSIT